MTCSRLEFKWETNNKRHYRLLAVPFIRYFEHHIVPKTYLTFGGGELMLFGIFMFTKDDRYFNHFNAQLFFQVHQGCSYSQTVPIWQQSDIWKKETNRQMWPAVNTQQVQILVNTTNKSFLKHLSLILTTIPFLYHPPPQKKKRGQGLGLG